MALDYFTLVELRATPDLSDPVKYPDAKLTTAGEWIQALIEREVHTSFVARAKTETLSGDDQDCDGGLKLATPYVLAVTAVTSNGVAFTAPQLAEVTVKAGVAIRRPAGSYTGFTAWDLGQRNIDFTLSTGYSTTPPSDVKEAALYAARDHVLRTSGVGVSDRTSSITNDAGTIQLTVPGSNRPTGLPDTDAVIVGWRDKLALYGFG